MRDDSKLKPDKIIEFHRLLGPDFEKRLNFAKWFLKTLSVLYVNAICTDEAYFSLKEPSNKQNKRVWLNEKPFEGIEKPLREQKILVFFAISVTKVFGPYTFTKSLNQHNNLVMFKDWLWSKHIRT